MSQSGATAKSDEVVLLEVHEDFIEQFVDFCITPWETTHPSRVGILSGIESNRTQLGDPSCEQEGRIVEEIQTRLSDN